MRAVEGWRISRKALVVGELVSDEQVRDFVRFQSSASLFGGESFQKGILVIKREGAGLVGLRN
jgi:hypothetical protein